MRAFGAPVNSRAKKTARWRADRLSLGLSGPLTAAPPSKKTTAHQDQAGEAGADDGTGHSYRFSKSNLRYAVQEQRVHARDKRTPGPAECPA
jgi:hypothetical protein